MKKSKSKQKSIKRTPKHQTSQDQLPSLVEGMTKLVERLVSLEQKMDQVLGKISHLTPRPVQASLFQRSESQAHPDMRPERTLYQAICADCQKNCEVPFKPGSRPVYCKECFAIRKAGHRKHSVEIRPGMKPAVQVPALLPENGIPSLKKAEMTVFEKKKKKSARIPTKKRK